MIIGLGSDIVNIARIDKSADFLAHLARKILGPDEQKELADKNILSTRALACKLAKYYAGKEAFAKAMGTGFINGIFLRDIQILHNDLGQPYLKICGQAKAHLQTIAAADCRLHISLSDDYPYAQAIVVIETK